jgi:hypothetical protein
MLYTEGMLLSEDQVLAVAKEADRSVRNILNIDEMATVGNIAEHVVPVGFTSVCDYIQKLIKIGDEVFNVRVKAITFWPLSLITPQIHPWASLAWSILSVIPKVRL